jgi:hypothetical protein
MMVCAGTHVDLSVSRRGWAHSIGYRTYYIFDYLLIIYFIIINLLHSVVPKDPKSCCLLMMTILWGTPWPPVGHRGGIVSLKHRQKVRPCRKGKTRLGQMLRAHLSAMAITSFRVGCCVESHLHRIFNVPLHLTALLSSSGDPGQVRFDSNSFPICVNNHGSYCMANSPHLFENLVLSNVGKVDGINEGLEIVGKSTFKVKIADDDGRAHIIHIPNLLYLPELKGCLLLPQHWAQEVGDGQTQMVNLAHHCVLQWANGRKTVPFNKSSITPISYTVSSSRAYQAFSVMFEALEAPFFQRETVIQIPGRRLLREDAEITPEEFIAKEDLHCGATKKKSLEVDEVDEEDATVCTSNLPPPPEDPEEPDAFIQWRPLTFDPSPPLAEDEDAPLAAADNQAELMRWHNCLGHLPFPKLKPLALNGKIPKKLAKLTPPKCAGCLFGAMTKLPWRGKESKSSHKVFVTTKPGETVSVDQTTLTEVGFFAQLKGSLTKKRYKCCTIFVDNYFCLRFVHLQINDSAESTMTTKLAFEKYATKHGVSIKHYHCNNG